MWWFKKQPEVTKNENFVIVHNVVEWYDFFKWVKGVKTVDSFGNEIRSEIVPIDDSYRDDVSQIVVTIGKSLSDPDRWIKTASEISVRGQRFHINSITDTVTNIALAEWADDIYMIYDSLIDGGNDIFTKIERLSLGKSINSFLESKKDKIRRENLSILENLFKPQ